MINFRFHLVSLIAVFLALALGVVVGSTVIDRAIVDGLEAQIDRVERNAEDQRRENGELRRDIEEVRTLSEQMAPFAIDLTLDGVPVAVFATRGINEDVARGALEAIREAGALAPAIVWLEPVWAVNEAAQREGLRDLLGAPRASADDARELALQELVNRVAAGESAPPPAGVPAAGESPPADVLSGLAERGFVTVDRAGGPEFDLATYPGGGARVTVVTGRDSEVQAEPVVQGLVQALADASLLTLAVDVSRERTEPETDGDSPPLAVELIRADGDLSGRISTVDGADTLAGRVAVVLALDQLGRGEHGHYGRTGARALPEPSRA